MTKGFVYILTNDRHTVLYTGCTNNLDKRLYHHKHRLVPGFTKKYNVHKLIYFEELPDMVKARRRERQIKGSARAKKEALIAGVNSGWSDLACTAELAPPPTAGDPSLRSG